VFALACIFTLLVGRVHRDHRASGDTPSPIQLQLDDNVLRGDDDTDHTINANTRSSPPRSRRSSAISRSV
jgi:hypothetical protein